MTAWRALAAVGVLLLAGCSSNEAATSSPSPPAVVDDAVDDGRISDEEAIRIAREEVESAFADFDFDGRRAQVVEVGDTLDVSFPTGQEMVLESEPHVILDAATGEVRERQLRG